LDEIGKFFYFREYTGVMGGYFDDKNQYMANRIDSMLFVPGT
jgi:hypothetical protein